MLRGHGDLIESVAFDPALPRVVTGSRDRTARAWDAVTGRKLFALPHSATVFRVGFNGRGDRFITATIDDTARVWDAREGGWLATLEAGSAPINALRFLSNGDVVTA